MYLLILFIPFCSFLISLLFGQYLGKKGVCFFTTFCLGLTAFIALFLFYEVAFCECLCLINSITWFEVGYFSLTWGFLFDNLSVTMIVMISIISFCVHLYSIEYMKKDPHQDRFMYLLTLFTFFMLILVTSENFIQLLLGWEGVGICSFLLISFWYTRIDASRSALKALFVNRIGDFFLMLALFVIFHYMKSLSFLYVLDNYLILKEENFIIFNSNFDILFVICILLTMGAIGKSAQIFLYVWLPDAMEGPTPVSALIHAATMVTAGIFLLARISPLLINSEKVLLFVCFFGFFTIILASITGNENFDIKKIIANSTASQLGYMFFSCGLGDFSFSIFHLFYHAFFKALLFLGAGSIIHAASNEQDIRKLGGLANMMPFTFFSMYVSACCLMGIPFIGSFYSKEFIIEFSELFDLLYYLLSFHCATVGLFFTIQYCSTILDATFDGHFRGFRGVIKNVHEAPLLMFVPLLILIIGSFYLFFLSDFYTSEENLFFVLEAEKLDYYFLEEKDIFENTFITSLIMYITFFIYFIKSSLFFFFFFFNENFMKTFFVFSKKYDTLSKNYFDVFYNKKIVNSFINFSNFFVNIFDKGFFEMFGPLFFIRKIKIISLYVSRLQTGFIYHYILFQFISIFVFLIFIINIKELSEFNEIIYISILYMITKYSFNR
jgi:proton-translocating NADH-quinone oxidoreductase chain L